MSRFVPFACVIFIGSIHAQTGEPPIFLPGSPSFQPAPSVHLEPLMPPAIKLLSRRIVQADMKLTDDQKAEVADLQDAWRVSPSIWEAVTLNWIDSKTAQSIVTQRTTALLSTRLTKEQRNRLDQIAYQLREREFGAHTAFAMAARDLGLRPDQIEDVQVLTGLRVAEIARVVTAGERFEQVRRQVSATNGETFEKMAEMLTRAQRERLNELRGRPFAGKVDFSQPDARTGPGLVDAPPPPPLPPQIDAARRSTGLPAGNGLMSRQYPGSLFGVYDLELRYLATRELRTELKFSAEQAKELDTALVDWNRAHLKLSGLDLDRSGQLHEQTARVLEETLKPEQRRRLNQIMMRRRLLVSPEAMCGHPAAVTALKLSPIQLQQFRNGDPAERVLTQDQKTAVAQLLGEPFDLPGGVVDPLIRRGGLSPTGAPTVHALPYAFARSFLLHADRLKLSASQIEKLRELADDEPRVIELLQRELSLSPTPAIAGASRGVMPVGHVIDRYKSTVDQQCWNVLDPQQQSLARKMFARRR